MELIELHYTALHFIALHLVGLGWARSCCFGIGIGRNWSELVGIGRDWSGLVEVGFDIVFMRTMLYIRVVKRLFKLRYYCRHIITPRDFVVYRLRLGGIRPFTFLASIEKQ